jgi:hypothetical protein
MKTTASLIFIGLMTIIVACNRTADRISGTYVTDTKNEFTILHDTLVISPYNESSGVYSIEKRSGYQLIRSGKVLAKQFKQKNWTATYNSEKQVLQETEFGRQIYLNLTAGTLSFGATYRKIN